MLGTRRTHLLVAVALALAAIVSAANAQTPAVTVFEGARVITGDGNVIEDAAFVIEGDRFVSVGRRADVFVPAGAVRVDLAGKTVMPTMTDLHGHLGESLSLGVDSAISLIGPPNSPMIGPTMWTARREAPDRCR